MGQPVGPDRNGPDGPASAGQGGQDAPATDARYRSISLWLHGLEEPLTPRKPLPGDTQVDVAIVGGGFTGLWTAYYLANLDPGLRVMVLEAEIAGFGASGRNGGWCSALFAASWAAVARAAGRAAGTGNGRLPSRARSFPGGTGGEEVGRPAALAMQRAMVGAVHEVERFCGAEGVDARLARGGTLTLARSLAQLSRLRQEMQEDSHWGVDVRWLEPDQVAARVRASRVLGATWQPDCAALDPGRLVRGLARVAERKGVAIHEQTRALRLMPGRVETDRGLVRAEVVVRATEGYTPQLQGLRRALVPVYSLMVATEPLPPEVWEELGWEGRETLTDGRHLLIYAQRTADGRIAFGGRGAPYHAGSGVHPSFDRDPATFAALEAALADLFPPAAGSTITHRWGGPLGVPRDWFPSVGFERSSQMGWAGGYVGDGVATTNLAGRTLADLILGRHTDLVCLPWVGHRSPQWEPEPFRWVGVNAGRWLAGSADAVEGRTGRPARRAKLLSRLTGG
jgi:glycine/D-amino acid oxidase-like deaminating enzyme